MAQTSLVKKPHFSDPANARAAGNHQNKRSTVGEEFVALRRQQIIDLKLRNLTTAEIAAHFNVSEATIERDVKYIKKNGLVEKYEAKFLGRMMPLAMRKLEKALRAEDGELDAVKEVLKRFDKLSEQKHQKELAEGGQKEETLSGWYDQWMAAKADAEAPPEDAVDTEIVAGGDPIDGNNETSGEAGAAAGSIGGSGTLDREGATEIAPPVGTNASEGRLEVAPEGGVGPGGDDSGGAGEGV